MVTTRRAPDTTGAGALVFTTRQAASAGMGRHAQANRVRRGEWVRLRPGVFCLASTWEAADRRGRHLLQASAAQCCWAGSVLSHLSAAAAWGWPLPLGDLGPPWLTVASPATPPGPGGGGGPRLVTDAASARRTPSARIEAAALPDADLVRLPTSGALGTGRARTVADCARHLPVADAVAIADAAAAGGLARTDVLAVLARQGSWPYVERGRAAVQLVDPRRESWLESVAVVDLHRRGAPLPQAQPVVRDRRGRFIARPDFWWPELGLVGEVDGWEKYRTRGLVTLEDAARALREEKQREDRIRDTGLHLVRGSSDEVLGGVFAQRWFEARGRGDAGRVRAQIVPAPWPASWPEPQRRR